jgi:hypothetical protein
MHGKCCVAVTSMYRSMAAYLAGNLRCLRPGAMPSLAVHHLWYLSIVDYAVLRAVWNVDVLIFSRSQVELCFTPLGSDLLVKSRDLSDDYLNHIRSAPSTSAFDGNPQLIQDKSSSYE